MGHVSRFELDPSARLNSDRRVLIGGSPVSLFRLSAAGSSIIDRIRSGESLTPGHAALTDRLVAAGALHPVYEPDHGPTASDVTLVIPAFGADAGRVQELARRTGAARTIVVDDASPTPFPEVPGIEVLRLGTNRGPGAARQAGLDMVTTPFVAFLDADTEVDGGWLDTLLPCFAAESVALVAPRVRPRPTEPGAPAIAVLLARFEALRGPLDLGPVRGRIRAATRISYVPAAALICRTAALRACGGFDPGMRLGEDVDLVWRLDEAGWMCRYEPATEVRHDVRPSLGAWLRQRSGYGSSATDLALRHPGSVAPVQVSVWSAVSWVLPAIRLPALGAVVAAGSTAVLARKLPAMPDRVAQAVRLAGLGHLHAGRILATALTRSWWPVTLAGALVSRRMRKVLLVSVAVPTLLEWWKVRRSLDPLRFAALRLLDDGAYGFGLWRGAWRRRSPAALLPNLTGWPGRAARQGSNETGNATPVGGAQQ